MVILSVSLQAMDLVKCLVTLRAPLFPIAIIVDEISMILILSSAREYGPTYFALKLVVIILYVYSSERVTCESHLANWTCVGIVYFFIKFIQMMPFNLLLHFSFFAFRDEIV